MSNNYDNWERLVEVVLRREKDRRLALADSRESSFNSSISSSFRFGPDSPIHEQNPQLEAYTVNLLGDKMGILGIEGKRWEEIGYLIEPQPAILNDMINRLLRFRFGPDSPFHEQNPQREAYTVNLLGEKMEVIGIEANRGKETAANGKGMEPAFLDGIINRLLWSRHASTVRQVQMSESEIRDLCTASRDIFLSQPNFLELQAPIKICGNIHGQYRDLLRLFELGGFPPEANYLFLGGYVNYGIQSIETICLLLAYKIKYPQNFFLLRGYQESASLNRMGGFYDECKRRYNVRLWKTFNDCFNCLPVAALIDEKILCVHGGISSDLHDFDQIRNLRRPTDVPDIGFLCDNLWWDPSIGNDREVNDRVTEFKRKHDLDLICRGHEVVKDGYEFFAGRQLVTIFSAPNFGIKFDNAGAMMSIDETLMCSFQTLKPVN